MDKWVEEFQKNNGRQPTSAELQAHHTNQASESAQLIAPPNTGKTQHHFNQSAQYTVPEKTPKAGHKAKRLFHSPLVMIVMVLAGLLIAFVMTGFLTSRSLNGLRNKYNAAIRNQDVKAILALFPKEQTESRFAEIGAKELINSRISFDKFAERSSIGDIYWRDEVVPYTIDDGITIVETKHFLFFKRYSLSARTTKIDKGNTPKGAKLSIGNREMTDRDFESVFFPGTYRIKAEVKTDFGGASFTQEILGGEYKYASLNFNIDKNYAYLPAGPASLTVSYGPGGEHKTNVKLSSEMQKVGPFTEAPQDVKVKKYAREPKDFLYLSGEYGGVTIKKAGVYDMMASRDNFALNEKRLWRFNNKAVTYDEKKLEPYVETYAREWFESGQTGAEKDSSARDDADKAAEVPRAFSNKNFKYAYKGFVLDKFEPYRFFTGIDEHLYVVADFKVLYTKTARDKKDARPVDSDRVHVVVFRLDADGSMEAVGNYPPVLKPWI